MTSTQTSGGIPSAAWQRLAAVLERNYSSPDLEAARILYSAVAAHRLTESVPTWPLLIAPPGSIKTDLLESLRGLPSVHFVDEITTKTFLSGKVDEKGRRRTGPASLLHRIGPDGILVAADFSTYTADPKTLQVILAQLRRIYDGNYSREFGTDEHLEERDWQGRLTVLAGAVPDVDRHHQLFQKLGERFFRLRWPRAGGIEAGLRAMRHVPNLAVELRNAAQALLRPILSLPAGGAAPILSAPMEVRIASLSEFVALSRSYVQRDRTTRDIEGVPVTEGNTRLPQQLCQLARGAALLDGRRSVEDCDFILACRAAFDSLPPARSAVLAPLIRGQNPYSVGLPPSTVQRALEDLQSVGVVCGSGVDGHAAKLSEEAAHLLDQAQAGDVLLSRK